MQRTGVHALAGAAIGQKVLIFLFFLVLSRVLGVEKTGDFIWATGYAAIFGFFIDWGLSPAITRHIAAHKSGGKDPVVVASWSWRIVWSCITYVLIVGSYGLLGAFVMHGGEYFLTMGRIWSWERFIYVIIAGTAVVGDSIAIWAAAVWRGKHFLYEEAISGFVGQLLLVSIGSLWLLLGGGLRGVLVWYSITSWFQALWLLGRLWKSGNFIPRLIFNFTQIRTLLQTNFGMIVAGGSMRIYNYADTLAVDAIAGTTQLGLYGLANKIILAIQFLPHTIAAKYFARLSALWHKGEKVSMRREYDKFLYAVITIGSIGGSSIICVSPILFSLVWPDFKEALPMMFILAWAVPCIFANFALGSLLHAIQRSGWVAAAIIVSLILNLSLVFLLVPYYGGIGAAWAALLATFVLTALYAFISYTIIYEIPHTPFAWHSLLLLIIFWYVVSYICAIFLPPLISLFAGMGSILITFFLSGIWKKVWNSLIDSDEQLYL